MIVISHEYHIDYSEWSGDGTAEFVYTITAIDGTVYKNRVQLFPGSDPETARAGMWFRLKPNGWRGYTVGNNVLVLEGSKNSPIKSVEFTSKDWYPIVRWVPKLPEKK